jgi:hypothetical protein
MGSSHCNLGGAPLSRRMAVAMARKTKVFSLALKHVGSPIWSCSSTILFSLAVPWPVAVYVPASRRSRSLLCNQIALSLLLWLREGRLAVATYELFFAPFGSAYFGMNR